MLTDKVAGTKKGIIDDPIVLTIHSEACPDLTLVDLPGMHCPIIIFLKRYHENSFKGFRPTRKHRRNNNANGAPLRKGRTNHNPLRNSSESGSLNLRCPQNGQIN